MTHICHAFPLVLFPPYWIVLRITGNYVLVPMLVMCFFLRPDMNQLGTVPVTPTCIPSGMTLHKITSVQNSFRHFISLPQLAPRMPSAGTSCMGVRMGITFCTGNREIHSDSAELFLASRQGSIRHKVAAENISFMFYLYVSIPPLWTLSVFSENNYLS